MKFATSSLFFVIGSLFVGVVWLVTVCESQETFGTASLESLFTGLAVIAAVAVFTLDRQKAADSDKEHRETLAEIRMAYRVQAIATKLGRYDLRKEGVGIPSLANASIHMGLNARSMELETLLDLVVGIETKG